MANPIEAAMTEALTCLHQITGYFREHDQHRAANEIGKFSTKIAEACQEGILNLSPRENVFDVVKSDNDHRAETHRSAPRAMIQHQAHMALMNEVERDRRGTANIELDRIQSPIGSAALQPGSWAQVAYAAPSVQESSSREIAQFLMSPTPREPSSTEDARPDAEGESGEELAPIPASVVTEIPEKAGVIRIYGKMNRDVVNSITSRIHEGPLYDIRVETNGRSRVVFQHASHALAFFNSNQDMEGLLGYGRFGSGYRVELAEIVHWNDDLHRMNQPIRERRRLSFARKRLFADNMSPEKWKQDIRQIAGAGNIDFLWVFNSGNATAVFTSTSVARKVLEVFNRWKEGRNVYSGVSVTYSSDPCEKELILVKENNRPNNGKFPGRRVIR
ncbi:hypothetical protein BJY01DRAFT_264222 [Aspergillus pseudoustus]|uniref:Uncharacterized protein n=1 Tax=Aspergillus pseudoustus TaxID=1810923 RepID=A0ABR4JUM8_9EURO